MSEIVAKHGHHHTGAVIKILKVNGYNLLLALMRTIWVVVSDFFSLMRSAFVPVCIMKSIMQMMTPGT